jgi:hypothetical protein
VGTVGKDHFKKWRERKTDKNYKFGLPHSLGLLHLLTGSHHGHTRIYRIDEVVKTARQKKRRARERERRFSIRGWLA